MTDGYSRGSRDARLARLRGIRSRIAAISCKSKSAHFGSSLSCVDILDSIAQTAGIAPEEITSPARPRIILSKGHAAMAFYATLEAWGLLPAGMLDHYLQDASALWGHVTRSAAAPVIDVSTGSLGHGLGLATGYALGYRLKRRDARIFCVLSDGECDEGSTWEAALFAGHHKLDRLLAVIDYNKIQSLDHVATVLDLEPFAQKWSSFGWEVREVDGHDPWAIDAALGASTTGRPLVIIAHTIKGKGVPRIENTVASHYQPAHGDDASNLIAPHA